MSEWIPNRLPGDVDAERSLLSTCCAPGAESQAAEAVAMLVEADFVHPSHRAVFIALRDLLERGEEVHSLNLKAALDARDNLHRVGGFSGLVEILAGEDVGRPGILVQRIVEKRRLRQLVHTASGIVRLAATEDGTADTLIESLSASLVALSQRSRSRGLEPLGRVGDRAMARIEEVAEGRALPGTATGFGKLDWLLGGGFKPKQIVVLAARPGVGKSVLLVQWLGHIARFLHHGAQSTGALFSLEMADEEIWVRAAGTEARVSGGRIATGQLDRDEWERLRGAREVLRNLPFLLCDQATITVPAIRAMTERAIVRYGTLGLVGVDYLQLLSSPDGSRGAKQNEAIRIGEISRGLKLMAKDLNIPVMVLSQLNREVEHRSGGRPQLSDLRDSGAVEQDADVVLFLHRRGEAGSPDTTYELIVAKNRNGPTGIIPLVADLEHFRFVELSRSTASPDSQPPPHRDSWGDAGLEL